MRSVFAAVLTISIAVLALAGAPNARAEDKKSLEAELRRIYEHKLLSLRNPFFGKTLSFDPSGVPMQQVVAGPWSTCGVLQVQKLRIMQDAVEIDGKRAILALRQEGGTPTRIKLQVEPILTSEPVLIRIQTPTLNVMQINDSVSRVFQGGRLVDRVAAYWKPMASDLKSFRLKTPNGIIGELEGTRPVYLVNPGVVEPPKVVYDPDPEYTEAARNKRLEGTTVLSVVVNEQGFPEILEITRGLGEGLDIQALAAVANWRFKPAVKGGKPIAVQITVEVSFHLG
jgi:TonB family protein